MLSETLQNAGQTRLYVLQMYERQLAAERRKHLEANSLPDVQEPDGHVHPERQNVREMPEMR